MTLSICPGIAGIVSVYPNPHVEVLKGQLWSDLLSLLGDEGMIILRQLFMDHSLYVAMPGGQETYKQLSGMFTYPGFTVITIDSYSV